MCVVSVSGCDLPSRARVRRGGGSYESIAGSSPASFSDSSYTMPTSPVFEHEPAYTAVNRGSPDVGMFQFGAQRDENRGALLALLEGHDDAWVRRVYPCACARVRAAVRFGFVVAHKGLQVAPVSALDGLAHAERVREPVQPDQMSAPIITG